MLKWCSVDTCTLLIFNSRKPVVNQPVSKHRFFFRRQHIMQIAGLNSDSNAKDGLDYVLHVYPESFTVHSALGQQVAVRASASKVLHKNVICFDRITKHLVFREFAKKKNNPAITISLLELRYLRHHFTCKSSYSSYHYIPVKKRWVHQIVFIISHCNCIFHAIVLVWCTLCENMAVAAVLAHKKHNLPNQNLLFFNRLL